MILCKMLSCFAALVIACACGCSRTVLVSESSPMRVARETVVRVYTLEEDGSWREAQPVVLPEGWYIVPPSYVEEP